MSSSSRQLTHFRKGDRSPFAPNAIPKSGALFQVDKERFDLVVFHDNLTDEEIYNYTNGRAFFGLYVHGPVIFLLSRFGSLPLCSAPYSICPVSRDLRGLPQGYAPGKQFVMQFLLVESTTNVIAGFRAIGLGPVLSQAFAGEVLKQTRVPCSRVEYEKAVADAYARYPNDEYMMEHALVLDPAGGPGNEPPRPLGNVLSEPTMPSRVGSAISKFSLVWVDATRTVGIRQGEFDSIAEARAAIPAALDRMLRESIDNADMQAMVLRGTFEVQPTAAYPSTDDGVLLLAALDTPSARRKIIAASREGFVPFKKQLESFRIWKGSNARITAQYRQPDDHAIEAMRRLTLELKA
jgi:hypothetical protein